MATENATTIRKWGLRLFWVVVGIWVLTLGLFVERTLLFGFQRETRVDTIQATIKARVVARNRKRLGIPYLLQVTSDDGPFGIAFLVQCDDPKVREISITEVSIDGVSMEVAPVTLSYSSGGSIPGVFNGSLHELFEGRNTSIDIVAKGTYIAEDRRGSFSFTLDELPISWETRAGTGWMMLLYYSQF